MYRGRSLQCLCFSAWAFEWRAALRARLAEKAQAAEEELRRRTEEEFGRLREVQRESGAPIFIGKKVAF